MNSNSFENKVNNKLFTYKLYIYIYIYIYILYIYIYIYIYTVASKTKGQNFKT